MARLNSENELQKVKLKKKTQTEKRTICRLKPNYFGTKSFMHWSADSLKS